MPLYNVKNHGQEGGFLVEAVSPQQALAKVVAQRYEVVTVQKPAEVPVLLAAGAKLFDQRGSDTATPDPRKEGVDETLRALA